MDRDNTTRTGAKDPWGREAMSSRTAARGATAGLDSERGFRIPLGTRAKGRGKPRGGGGYAGSKLNRVTVRAGAT